MLYKTPPLLAIGDFLVSPEIITAHFACDYPRCLGACCIIGDSGAPLGEGEEELLRDEYNHYAALMTEEGRSIAQSVGFAVKDIDGDDVTPLLEGGGACIFTHFEPAAESGCANGENRGQNCLCAVELAHLKGECRFVKPISCRLYPVRVSTLSNGIKVLNLHRWDICRDAFAKGRRENIRVFEFLKGPLTDAFGSEFYEALEAAAKEFA